MIALLFHAILLYVHSLFLPYMYFMKYALSEMTKQTSYYCISLGYGLYR